MSQRELVPDKSWGSPRSSIRSCSVTFLSTSNEGTTVQTSNESSIVANSFGHVEQGRWGSAASFGHDQGRRPHSATCSHFSRQQSSFQSRSKSFLYPTGVRAQDPPPKEIGAMMEIVVFLIFVLVRACHPVIIDASKVQDATTGKRRFFYHESSAVVVSTCAIAFGTLIICLVVGGREQFKSIFRPIPLLVFSINGFVYLAGDILEMASMGSLHGAAYQILMQSRILLTVLLMMFVKGVEQSRLQWLILFMLMTSMSAYMVIMTNEEDDGAVPLLGMFFAFLKVVISCVGAVVSDKYMKVYKDDPTHVQIARIYIARPVFLLILTFASDALRTGFFDGWNAMTIAVTASFIVKSVSSLYILSLLDSILKNVAEAFSVLVIYAFDILAPWVDKSFDIATFLAVLVVVSACAAYIDSKAPLEKAALYDESLRMQELSAKLEGAGASPVPGASPFLRAIPSGHQLHDSGDANSRNSSYEKVR